MTTFTSGPWSYCCDKCVTVSCADFPVAKATCGDWGDDFPTIQITGHGPLDAKAEAVMRQYTYGHVPQETAIANARLIAAAPEMYEALELSRAIVTEGGKLTFEPGTALAAVVFKIDEALKKARGEQ